jgi:hypothetical protein
MTSGTFALLAMVCAVLLAAALGLLHVRSRRRARSRPANSLPSGFDRWSRERKLAYLRHPQHRQRCSCRRYGMLGAVVRDQYGLHAAACCQPDREVVD